VCGWVIQPASRIHGCTRQPLRRARHPALDGIAYEVDATLVGETVALRSAIPSYAAA
jgi:hypothetical protein